MKEEMLHTVRSLTEKLPLSKELLLKYIKKGDFPNAFKLPSDKGGWQIPEGDIKIFLQNNPSIQQLINDINTIENSKEMYLTTEQVAERLNIQIQSITNYLRDGMFPNALKLPPGRKGGWRIPESEVENILKGTDFQKLIDNISVIENSTERYFTTEQVAQKLNKQPETIRNYLRDGVFPNAIGLPSGKGGWQIPESDIRAYVNKYENFVGIREVTEKLDIHEETVLRWLKKGIPELPSAKKVGKQWLILKKELDNLSEKINNSVNIETAVKELEVSKNTIYKYIKGGHLPNAYKFCDEWKIPKTDLEQFSFTFRSALSVEEARKKLNISENKLYSMLNEGEFPNAKKLGESWKIPESDLLSCLKIFLGKLSVEEASKKLNVTKVTLNRWIKLSYFPNAELTFRGWIIPESDVRKIIEENNQNHTKSAKRNNHSINIYKQNGFLTIKEVAKHLNKSERVILGWLKEGICSNAKKFEGIWWIPEEDLVKLREKLDRINKYTSEGAEFEILCREDVELTLLKEKVKTILKNNDLGSFSELLQGSNSTLVHKIVRLPLKKDFEKFISVIIGNLVKEKPNKKIDVFSVSTIYRTLYFGSPLMSKQKHIPGSFRETLTNIVLLVKEKWLLHLKESLINFNKEAFWDYVPYFSPSQLFNFIESEMESEFRAYVKYCGNELVKNGQFVKAMPLAAYCFYGNLSSESSVDLWKFLHKNDIFHETVKEIYNIFLDKKVNIIDFDLDIWVVNSFNIQAIEKVTLDFTSFEGIVKNEIKSYIYYLIKISKEKDPKKIQSRLGALKNVFYQFSILPYSINSCLGINYHHAQHLLVHYQTLMNEEGEEKYRLSTIRIFFTEIKLLVDWLLEKDENYENSLLSNPFRRIPFVNTDAYIENTEHIPEEVIEQMKEVLHELQTITQNAWTIMMNTGMRVSSVLNLEEDCLDEKGKVPVLKFIPPKEVEHRVRNGMEEYHYIPVNDAVVDCVKDQFLQSRDLRVLGNTKNIFLINNGYVVRKPYTFDFTNEINSLLKKHKILDADGSIFKYTNHMCRKTVSVDLLSKGYSIEEVADYLGHLSSKTTEKHYRSIQEKTIAQLDAELFEQLFEETIDQDVQNEYSFDEKKSLIREIKLGARETPEGHGHCVKHVAFGPCVKKKCVGCRLLVTGPQKLPKWRKLYEEQKDYLNQIEEEYEINNVKDYKSFRQYQEQQNLLEIYNDTINKIVKFCEKRGISINETS